MSNSIRARLSWLVCCLCLLGQQASADDFEVMRFFEEHVRPVLASRCLKCHGPDKQEGGLRLDSADAARQGGDSGAALVPGDTEASLLVDAIHYRSLEMPPDGQLDEREIAALTRWIEVGAPWPDHTIEPVSEATITREDREFWAFQPLSPPDVPDHDDGGWSRTAIDRFIYHRLADTGLSPAQAADRPTLIRRLYFDLLGLPPSVSDVERFTRDLSPDAYGRLVDRLLEDPRYGEKWARHWLDLVRYAESHGHGSDQYRPDAYRYRDYVVNSFNDDMPYDQFVKEQLAGDELSPGNPQALVATGFLRHWIYESNQRKVRLTREIILNDVTEVTGEVFLAMGMGCARCHDHKFDPISRRDYYRLQAFFAPMLSRDDVPLLSDEELAARHTQLLQWQRSTAEIRDQIAEIERPIRRKAIDRAIRMLPQEIKDIYRKPRSQNTPLELQLVALVQWQVRDDQKNPQRRLTGQAKKRWQSLMEQLAEFDAIRPDPIPYAMVVKDIGPVSPPTVIPGDAAKTDIVPGFLSVLDDGAAPISPPPSAGPSTGRRAALAKWIADPKNPLSTRVIVNRIWHYHFGRGLVGTPSDFGRLGDRPSHPGLLDWLASQFVADGWSLKMLHRRIVTSATYRQMSLRPTPDLARTADPANRLLWRMPIRRLDAEQLRDAVLAISGELDQQLGGPGVEAEVPRRTLYNKIFRNSPDPLLRVFDGPDGFVSTAQRDVTTTPTQALTMINGDWALERAVAWAEFLQAEFTGLEDQVKHALCQIRGSAPGAGETESALAFLDEQQRRVVAEQPELGRGEAERIALEDFCHVLLNSNALLYVD